RHAQDAEDAFQATFLVLARKAAAVADREAVGSWLYRVAYRAALAARAANARRTAKEQQGADMPHPQVLPEEPRHDLAEGRDAERGGRPEKCGLAVGVCEWEGRPRREAARQLGIQEGTLSSRLTAARKALARRLARYGLGLGGAALGPAGASARVPAPLV